MAWLSTGSVFTDVFNNWKQVKKQTETAQAQFTFFPPSEQYAVYSFERKQSVPLICFCCSSCYKQGQQQYSLQTLIVTMDVFFRDVRVLFEPFFSFWYHSHNILKNPTKINSQVWIYVISIPRGPGIMQVYYSDHFYTILMVKQLQNTIPSPTHRLFSLFFALQTLVVSTGHTTVQIGISKINVLKRNVPISKKN